MTVLDFARRKRAGEPTVMIAACDALFAGLVAAFYRPFAAAILSSAIQSAARAVLIPSSSAIAITCRV